MLADSASLWSLQDKHVLILGHGGIGRALEARLKPFGAQVTGVMRSGRDGTVPVAGAAMRLACKTVRTGKDWVVRSFWMPAAP